MWEVKIEEKEGRGKREENRKSTWGKREHWRLWEKEHHQPATICSRCSGRSVFKCDMMFGVNELTLTLRVRACCVCVCAVEAGVGSNNHPPAVIDSSWFCEFFPRDRSIPKLLKHFTPHRCCWVCVTSSSVTFAFTFHFTDCCVWMRELVD